MYDDFDDFDDFLPDDEAIQQMHLVLHVSARKILDETPVDDFLSWARQSIPELAPALYEPIPADERTRAAYWMGVDLWNAAPQPGNHYKPQPLAIPGRNAPCPCGSGLKYKQCCATLAKPEGISTEPYWLMFAEVLSKKDIIQLITSHQLPASAISIMTDHFDQEGDCVQVIKMLEPLFAGQANGLNHKHSGLLDLLCDCYNIHYKTDKKKKDLLQRMTQHKDRVIRAEAWQRSASWLQDQGDFAAAMEALGKAMQADPDNPSHSLLELTLLVACKRYEQAKQRATFWLHKLRKFHQDMPELIDTLQRAQSDPLGALQLSISQNDQDPRLQQLIDWIELNSQTSPPLYTASALMEADEEQMAEEVNPVENPMHNAVSLNPPQDITQLELQWHQVYPIGKPFSVQFEPMSNISIWDELFDTDWLSFLQLHPQAINSLDVMDDIVTLIYMHPGNYTIWGPLDKIQPLLDRAENIIRQAQIPADHPLPWMLPENRPALRLLVHAINLSTDKGNEQAGIEIIKHYLKLNPQDSHGYRSMLINHYLKQGMNTEALALTQYYPDDMLAETRFGEVLALYRLGELAAAKKTLNAANEVLPLVGPYLLKAKVGKPRFSEHGISYGGKDQAWVYREEMRDSWLGTDGCMVWLKKQLG